MKYVVIALFAPIAAAIVLPGAIVILIGSCFEVSIEALRRLRRVYGSVRPSNDFRSPALHNFGMRYGGGD